MAETKARKTNYDFQVFKAIAITLICAGHMWNKGFGGPFDLFPGYSFHVAAFAFVGGYFYNPRNDAAPLRYIGRKARALLVPTFLFNVAYGALAVWLHRLGFDWQGETQFYYELNFDTLVRLPLLSGHQFNLNYVMWFVPSLFFAEAGYVLVRRLASLPGKPAVTEAVACATAVLLGAWAIRTGGESGLPPSVTLMMGRSCFLMAFVGIGRLVALRPQLLPAQRALRTLALCCLLQLVLTFACEGDVRYVAAWLRFPHGVMLTYLVTLNGIAFWLCVSKILAPSIGKSRAVNAVANSTYSIMMHHRLGFFLLSGAYFLISRHTPLFSDFSVEKFMVEESFHYYPGGYVQSAMIYLIVGMGLPLLMHGSWGALKRRAGRTSGSL